MVCPDLFSCCFFVSALCFFGGEEMKSIPEYVIKMRQKIGHERLLLVGACVILENSTVKILLQQRTSGEWGLPGGLLELGESLAQTAIREVKEETGLSVTELRQLHTFSGEYSYATLKNQDKIYMVTTLYQVTEYHGTLVTDRDESLQFKYFSYDKLPKNFAGNYKRYLNYYLENIKGQGPKESPKQ